MLVTLTGYVVVAGRTAVKRTRWALAAGVGVLAVEMALQLFWYSRPLEDFHWIAPFYQPLDGGPARVARPDAALLDLWRQAIDRERVFAFLNLLAVLCFAVGVFTLPGWRGPRRAALTAILALLMLAVVGPNVWNRLDGPAVLDQLGTVWPALLATLLAVGLVGMAGRRADHAWLVAAGTFLVAVVAATAFDDLAGAWSAWWRLSQPSEDAFLSAAVSVSLGGQPLVSAALRTAAELTGPALLALGALRASSHSGPQAA
jgi:hypothetical protein